MKDRTNVAALVIALEAIVVSLARTQMANATPDQQKEFGKMVSDELAAITGEVIALAPVTGRGAKLAPAAARSAAVKIQEDSGELAAAIMSEIFPAPLTPLAAPKK